MSYQDLQNAYQLQRPAPGPADPTKELLKQGSNFAKEMAGERGIMAGIEAAHFRPIIQKYIKSKLADPKGFANSIQNDVNKVKQKASDLAGRATATAQQAKQAGGRIRESLQGTGTEEDSPFQIGEGGYFTPRRAIRTVEPPDRTVRGIRKKVVPESDEPSEGEIASARQNLGGIFARHEQEMTDIGRAVRARDAASTQRAIESTRAAKAAREGTTLGDEVPSLSQIGAKPAPVVKVLPTDEDLARAARTGTRSIAKSTPEPSVPSASTPAPKSVDFPDAPRYGQPGNPLRGEDAPPPPARPSAEQPTPRQPTADDFPSVPKTESQPIEPRGELDEFGLPKLPEPPKPKASVGQQTEEVGKDIAKEEVKTSTAEEGEAAAPGIGDVLAVGTALYGAIKGAVEAHHAMQQAKQYTPPPMAKVAMDSAPTFDSTFRGGN